MKDGADAEGSANGHDGFHGGVKGRGVEESETVFAEGGCAVFGGEGDGDAEGFEDVGGAGLAGDGAVAVFGDEDFGSGGRAGGCCDEGGGGGYVEGAAGVSAGAAGVYELQLFGLIEGEMGGGGAHGVDEAGDLFGGFAAGGEGGEESGDVEIGGLGAEDGLEDFGGFGAGEGFAVLDNALKVGLERHFF